MGCKTIQLPMTYLGLPLGEFQVQNDLGSNIREDGVYYLVGNVCIFLREDGLL